MPAASSTTTGFCSVRSDAEANVVLIAGLPETRAPETIVGAACGARNHMGCGRAIVISRLVWPLRFRSRAQDAVASGREAGGQHFEIADLVGEQQDEARVELYALFLAHACMGVQKHL